MPFSHQYALMLDHSLETVSLIHGETPSFRATIETRTQRVVQALVPISLVRAHARYSQIPLNGTHPFPVPGPATAGPITCRDSRSEYWLVPSGRLLNADCVSIYDLGAVDSSRARPTPSLAPVVRVPVLSLKSRRLLGKGFACAFGPIAGVVNGNGWNNGSNRLPIPTTASLLFSFSVDLGLCHMSNKTMIPAITSNATAPPTTPQQ
jgi:hypothetical protein